MGDLRELFITSKNSFFAGVERKINDDKLRKFEGEILIYLCEPFQKRNNCAIIIFFREHRHVP